MPHTRNHRLLLDEPPLVVSPTLATILGLADALFLQQVHFWCEIYRRKGDRHHYHQGRWWIYNSTRAWHDQLPFISEPTINRIIERTNKRGVLLLDNFNYAAYDQTRWYAIDYDELDTQVDAWQRKQDDLKQSRPFYQTDQMDFINPINSTASDRSNGLDQNDQIDFIGVIKPIPETTHEITHETNTDCPSPSHIWQTCQLELSYQTTKAAYAMWIEPLSLVALDRIQRTAIVQCPDSDHQQMAIARHDTIIARTLAGILRLDEIAVTYTLQEETQ